MIEIEQVLLTLFAVSIQIFVLIDVVRCILKNPEPKKTILDSYKNR